MTLEGGKPLVENSDEVGWTAAAFDYYAEIGRDSAGRVIPSIEATQLALVVKEPVGVGRLHRALELSAAAPGLEARAGAGGRQHDRLQALGADAALDPGRWRRASTTCRPASSTCSPGPATSAPRIVADERRRLRRLHRVGRDRQADRRRLRRAGRPDQPRDGRQGPVHRLLRRRRADRRRRQGGRLGGVPERGPGLHLRRALLRDGGRLRRLPAGVRRLHRRASGRRPAWTRPPTSARWSRRPSARRSSTRSRRRSPPAPRS